MGFTIEQATTALHDSGGSLDIALNSLLPPDKQNVPTNGQPAVSSGTEARTTTSTVTSNGPVHRNNRTDTRSHHQPPDSSHNDRTGILKFLFSIAVFC